MALIALACAMVLAVLVLWAVGPAPLFGVTGGELYSSVSEETGEAVSGGEEECEHVRRQVWRCELGSSGGVTYVVEVNGDGCWKARRIDPGGEHPLRRRPSACIGLDDLIRL
jgi:hypothetical protein